MTKTIIISPYNPIWPTMYNEEANKIKENLGDNCLAIHHVGSTSVSGLAAKPIIDILPVVQDLSEVDKANQKMEELGYEVKGEYGFLLRRYFVKNQFNVHVFDQSNTEIKRFLNFRNWLREHPGDRMAYENLKRQLAKEFKSDTQGYAFAKSNFVSNIDKQAGWDGIRVVKALSDEEWSFVEKHSLRKNRVLSHNDENCYLMLLHYAEVVGFAHVNMPIKGITNIKQIFIEDNCTAQFRPIFLASINKWLLSLGFSEYEVTD